MNAHLKEIAAEAGWDYHSLIFIMCAWLEQNGHMDSFLAHAREACDEEGRLASEIDEIDHE